MQLNCFGLNNLSDLFVTNIRRLRAKNFKIVTNKWGKCYYDDMFLEKCQIKSHRCGNMFSTRSLSERGALPVLYGMNELT